MGQFLIRKNYPGWGGPSGAPYLKTLKFGASVENSATPFDRPIMGTFLFTPSSFLAPTFTPASGPGPPARVHHAVVAI